MAEILEPEDSVYFRSWGRVSEGSRVTFTAVTLFDSESIGRLPTHQWVLPDVDDWDHADGLLAVQEMFEGAPPPEWGQKDAIEISSNTKGH